MSRRAVWTKVLAALCVVGSAEGMRWDFDANCEGWLAREGVGKNELNRARVPSTVDGGVWRVRLPDPDGRTRGVELVSPALDVPSELFDRVEVRVRIVGATATQGYLGLRWTTESNRLSPGEYGPAGAMSDYFAGYAVDFGPEWLDATIGGLRTGAPVGRTTKFGHHRAAGIAWEGRLQDIRVEVEPSLVGGHEGRWLEVDSIVLTGDGEDAQGEMEPLVARTRERRGSLYGTVATYPMPRGVGRGVGRMACLADVDADRDADVVCLWTDPPERGWCVALNDGQGGFSLGVSGTLRAPGQLGVEAGGAPGAKRVLLRRWVDVGVPGVQVLRMGQEGLRPELDLGDGWPLGLADMTGDGISDALVAAHDRAEVLLYDLAGEEVDRAWAVRTVVGPSPSSRALQLVPAAPGRTPAVLWRRDGEDPSAGYYLSQVWEEGGGSGVRFPVSTSPVALKYVGDVDNDGDVDAIGAIQVWPEGMRCRGLSEWRNEGDGTMRQVEWLPDVGLGMEPVLVGDLNGDGWRDVAFADDRERYAGVVVALGDSGMGWRLRQEYYPIEGGGGPVLAGDIDSDGDVDLLVVDGQMGLLHVLWNQMGPAATSISPPAESPGSGTSRSAPYPNPFNSSVRIPVASTGDGKTRVQIYDILGREVCTLLDARLPRGTHDLEWTGVSAEGRGELGAGVYIVRTETSGGTRVQRIVKVK